MLTYRYRQSCIEFAKADIEWEDPINIKNLRNVLRKGETTVNLVGSDSTDSVRHKKTTGMHSNCTMKTFKLRGAGVMVWRCFSWLRVGSLFWLKETMDRFVYLLILNEIMLHYAEWKIPLNCQFQQDNDPKQTSIKVRTWLTAEKIDLMIWPSQSPDLISI